MPAKSLYGMGLTALKSNFSPLRRPYKLTFAITYWCQSRCTMCNIWEARPKGELGLDEIKQFASRNTHFKWLEITGGEPFLRGDIVEVVRAFADTSKALTLLTIPTNSLCNHDMVISKIEQMLSLGIPRIAITISLDGHRELHDRIRGVPGNYDKAIDMYRRLQALKGRHKNLFFVFGYTMLRENQGQFEATYQAVKKDIPQIGYDDFFVNVGQLSDIYYTNSSKQSILADKDAMATEIEGIIKARGNGMRAEQIIERAFLRRLVRYVRTNKSPMRSRSLDASLFMDSYGNVYPSIMWGRKLGNIKETAFSLDSIWESTDAEEVRKLIKEGKEPDSWTACEAYQALVGDVKSLII
jgi:MoaA/NifB/PqqE/SkfB family radical SAM enzyme